MPNLYNFLQNEAEGADESSMSLLHGRHKKDVCKVASSNILITNGTFCVLHITNGAGIHSLPLHCRYLSSTRLPMTPWCNQQHYNLITWYKQNTWNLVTTQIRNWYFALSDRNDCTFHTQTELCLDTRRMNDNDYHTYKSVLHANTLLSCSFPMYHCWQWRWDQTDTTTRSANMHFPFLEWLCTHKRGP